uniref:ornithine carbamoyltransferase n=1 Tax=Macrostomum lignano TaxID=282301 RepID=A0A1I8FK13_9PLAT
LFKPAMSPLQLLIKVGRLAVVQSPRIASRAASSTAASTDKWSNLKGRHFLTLRDYSESEIAQLLWTAKDLKARHAQDRLLSYRPLEGHSLGMIFEKRSTRTRALRPASSCSAPVFLSPQDVHLGTNESLPDTAKVLSGFCDAVLARVYAHDSLMTLSEHSSVPIVNGLSDQYHPLQVLADFSHRVRKLWPPQRPRVGFCRRRRQQHDALLDDGLPQAGHIRIASPAGYDPNPAVVYGTQLVLTRDPAEAVRGADVIVTDTFVSMGAEAEKERRLKDFKGFQPGGAHAKPRWVFMHCLPRKQEEVTDDIFYDSKRSLVWPESHNRKWTVMSVLLNVLNDQYRPACPMPSF